MSPIAAERLEAALEIAAVSCTARGVALTQVVEGAPAARCPHAHLRRR
jgi:hypothetical protein